MARRLTTEEFIEKARSVHGSRYDYDRTVYRGSQKGTTITCPDHGDFEQKPNDHLSGSGCAKCRNAGFRLTTGEFVEKARSVHGGRYGYERAVYVTAKNKIIITCPEHGDFEQRASSHLSGCGCTKCRHDSDRLTTEEFIEKARLVYNNRYDYLSSVYVDSKKKVTITCPEHGDFEQIPASHLRGNGCPKCAMLSNASALTSSSEEFIEKARGVHGSWYGYERAVYVTSKNRITITCPEHGDFRQTPNSHLRGCGCHKCSVTGFNPDKQAYLYILLDTETHSRVKIGISNVPDKRLVILKNRTPFTLERIDLFETPPTVTLQLESFCHSQLDSANLTGFDGATEWFKFDGGKLEALRSFIRSCGGVQE